MQERVAPLSRHQRAIWLEALLYPKRPIFNIGTYVLLSGVPDSGLLELAVQNVIENHDALRIKLIRSDVEPQLRFKETQPFQLKISDFSSREAAENWMRKDFVIPISIDADILFDIQLVRFDNQAFLYLKHHHIYIDGWARAVLVREIAARYNALQNNSSIEAAPSYRNYLQNLDASKNLNARSYWKKRFATFERNALFTPLKKGSQTPSSRFILPWKSTSFFKEHTQKDQFYVQLASLLSTLAITYSREEITIGIPLLNRFNEEERNTIGYFVGLIPLKVQIPEDIAFSELVETVRIRLQESREYRDLSIQEINHAIGMQTNEFAQAYDVVFSFEPHDHQCNFGTIQTTEAGTFSSDFEQNPLVIHAQQFVDSDAVDFVFDYNLKYLDSDTIQQLAKRFERVLNTVSSNKKLLLSELPVLNATEQAAILSFSQGRKEKLRYNSLFDWISEASTNVDQKPILFDGAKQWTSTEIHDNARLIGATIQGLTLPSGSHVGILLPRSAEVILSIAGCIYAGVPYVFIDPNLGHGRINQMLKDANVAVLISENDAPFDITSIQLSELDSQLPWNAPVTNLDDPVYAFFTSGSTGIPKGVSISHRGVVNLMQELNSSFFQNSTPDSKLAFVSSFAFDASVQFVFAHLCLGLPLYIVPETARKDGRELATFFAKHQITHSDGIPSHLTALYLRNSTPPRNFQTKHFLIGGEAMDKVQIRRFMDWCNYPIQITNAYGPTECSVDATLCTFDAESIDAHHEIPIGKPLINSAIHLLDPRGIQVPAGSIGEICISGFGLAIHYLNATEITKSVFIDHPKIGRIYKTGDLGKWLPDGALQFMGRKDRQVKIRGFRIELKEIESALNQLSGIEKSHVFIKQSEHTKVLIAAIQSQKELDTSAIRNMLLESLPEYMIPQNFSFLKEFPQTASGKTDHKQLEALPTTISTSNTQPETETEKEVAVIVSGILDIELPDITRSFYALGGDSLSLVYLITELEETFQVELPVHQVSDRNAIREIAAFLDSKIEDEAPTVNLENAVSSALTWDFPKVLPEPASATSALLTGATGFVGAFLLDELLHCYETVYCIIRSASELHAHLRLKASVEQFGIDLNTSDSRIRYIAGDLSKPQLGLNDQKWTELSESVGAIYHNGAEVHFLKNTRSMYASNVGGTSELLQLSCTNTLKKFHFISTVGVFSETETRIDENHEIAHQIHSENRGYESTKWIAEELVNRARSAGIPCSIYRLARVTGHSKEGNPNYNDFFHRFLLGCLDLERFPKALLNQDTDLTPINTVVQGIVALSLSGKEANYHLINPHRLNYTELLDALDTAGHPLEVIDTDDFLKKAAACSSSATHPLYTIMPILKQKSWFSVNSNRFVMQRTLEELKALNIEWPEVNDLLPNYIQKWIEHWKTKVTTQTVKRNN